MRSRASAVDERAAIDRPIPNSLHTARSDEIPLRSFPGVAPPPRPIDAGLFLFALCKQLQMVCLDPRGIDCHLDSDGAGKLPPNACRMLGFMVSEIVRDASECRRVGIPRPAVTVTLHRRGAICLCTISKNGLDNAHESPQPGLLRVLNLARELPGHCLVRSMPDRGAVAIMFEVDFSERCFPAAISRSRVNEV